MMLIMIKQDLLVIENCDLRYFLKVSFRVNNRSTPIANKVKIEVGITINQAIVYITHRMAPCFQTLWRKRNSMSKGMAREAVTRSEIARDRRNRCVVLLRRTLLLSMVQITATFPTAATNAIAMRTAITGYMNAGPKRGTVPCNWGADALWSVKLIIFRFCPFRIRSTERLSTSRTRGNWEKAQMFNHLSILLYCFDSDNTGETWFTWFEHY